MSSRPKIDSIYDFTEKGLVEVKAWLEPWFKPQSSAGGGGEGGSGSGIQFDTEPQDGGFLYAHTETAMTDDGWGIQLEDVTNGILVHTLSSLRLESASYIQMICNGQIDINSGNSPLVISTGAGELNMSAGDVKIASAGGTPRMWMVGADVIFRISTTFTERVIIQDQSGNSLFRVDANGDLHGKTGKALVFDL